MNAGDLVVNTVGWVDFPAGEVGVVLDVFQQEVEVHSRVKVLFPSGVRTVYTWEVEPLDDFKALMGSRR